jgi:hypothetical protein
MLNLESQTVSAQCFSSPSLMHLLGLSSSNMKSSPAELSAKRLKPAIYYSSQERLLPTSPTEFNFVNPFKDISNGFEDDDDENEIQISKSTSSNSPSLSTSHGNLRLQKNGASSYSSSCLLSMDGVSSDMSLDDEVSSPSTAPVIHHHDLFPDLIKSPTLQALPVIQPPLPPPKNPLTSTEARLQEYVQVVQNAKALGRLFRSKKVKRSSPSPPTIKVSSSGLLDERCVKVLKGFEFEESSVCNNLAFCSPLDYRPSFYEDTLPFPVIPNTLEILSSSHDSPLHDPSRRKVLDSVGKRQKHKSSVKGPDAYVKTETTPEHALEEALEKSGSPAKMNSAKGSLANVAASTFTASTTTTTKSKVKKNNKSTTNIPMTLTELPSNIIETNIRSKNVSAHSKRKYSPTVQEHSSDLPLTVLPPAISVPEQPMAKKSKTHHIHDIIPSPLNSLQASPEQPSRPLPSPESLFEEPHHRQFNHPMASLEDTEETAALMMLLDSGSQRESDNEKKANPNDTSSNIPISKKERNRLAAQRSRNRKSQMLQEIVNENVELKALVLRLKTALMSAGVDPDCI